MARARALLTILAILCAAIVGGGAPVQADTTTATAFGLPSGLDIHDGSIDDFGGTYYAYGTSYGCGYTWYTDSPWCGFKVSSAPSLSGPWSTPTTLVSPSQIDPANGDTLNDVCGEDGGHGCFNPRMIQRSDGVYILWFNAVANRTSTTTSAYVVMGCNGPTGGCGTEAGAPHGTTHIPALHQCDGNNGDFTITETGTTAILICSYGGVLSEEQLDTWWTNGSGTGSTSLAGLTSVEAPGVWQDAASGTWLMTFSDVECGYCTGTGTGYATASSPLGPWTSPVNLSAASSTTPAGGRRDITATSCGGQPRTVSVVDGVPYQGIDLWTGSRNETTAGVLYSPLTYTPTSDTPGDGQIWTPPVSYPC